MNSEQQVHSALTHDSISVIFYSSHFCEPCARTRRVVDEVEKLLPWLVIEERDVAACQSQAQADQIRSTPTILIRSRDGSEVMRATGIPTVTALLNAISAAV